MYKLFLIIGSVFGALSVMIGAFGAHALKSVLMANQRIDTFDTAVKYQFYHTFAIIVVALLTQKSTNKWLELAGWSFTVGIIIFSGSLYALSITNIGKLGAITPIGGVFMIAGWLFILVSILK